MKRTVLTLAAVAMLLSACSSSDTKTSGSNSGSQAPAGGEAPAGGVTIKDFAFQVPADVAAGATVTVTNSDGARHTFSDAGGAFDVAVAGGGSETFTAPAAGTYEVICKIHSSMKGTLVVK